MVKVKVNFVDADYETKDDSLVRIVDLVDFFYDFF